MRTVSTSRIRLLAGPVAALAVGLAAWASAPKVEVEIKAHKEVVSTDASGKRTVKLVPATEAGRGDTIVYTLRVSNAGTDAALDPRIEDPIPEGTTLVLDSVAKDGSHVEASLDGGKSWQAYPATVTRTATGGGTETVPAPAESYTTLRWVLNGPLQPGDGKDVSFKVRIR